MTMMACGNQNDWPTLSESDNTTSTDEEEEVSEPGVNAYGDYELAATEVNDISEMIGADTMTVAINTSAMAEDETITAAGEDGYDDFVENFLYDEDTQEYDTGVKRLVVTYSNGGVSCQYYSKKGNLKSTFTQSTSLLDEDDEDVVEAEVTIDGQHVTVKATKKFNYQLTGTGSEGSSFKLYSDKKFMLTLSDVTLINDAGSAINLQKAITADSDGKLKGKRGYIIINGDNTLMDSEASAYAVSEEDEKGVIFSEGKLFTSGTGTLNIIARGKNGIATDDYLYTHAGPVINIETRNGESGVKTNDGITIGGGVMNITADGDAARGLNTDSTLVVLGGRTTIVNTGEGAVVDDESKHAFGIKASRILVYGGELSTSVSGYGSIGMKADLVYVQNAGTVKVINDGTTNATSSYTASADDGSGIVIGNSTETVGEAYLNGGILAVRALGDTAAVALRAYNNITVTGSIASLYGYASGLQARRSVWIKGGVVYTRNATSTTWTIEE